MFLLTFSCMNSYIKTLIGVCLWQAISFLKTICLVNFSISAGCSSRTILRLSLVPDSDSLIIIRLSTSHHAFSLGRSVSTRSVNSFYYLQRVLSSLHPYLTTPSLSPSRVPAFFSRKSKLNSLATFLASILQEREFLSNKALHLFLQTQLSIEMIQKNLDGLRDDDVPKNPLVDRRTNSKNGFSQIFADSSWGE